LFSEVLNPKKLKLPGSVRATILSVFPLLMTIASPSLASRAAKET
jgi:hypothetical protein